MHNALECYTIDGEIFPPVNFHAFYFLHLTKWPIFLSDCAVLEVINTASFN